MARFYRSPQRSDLSGSWGTSRHYVDIVDQALMIPHPTSGIFRARGCRRSTAKKVAPSDAIVW